MRNTYKVPKKQWRRWSETAKKVFNETYEASKFHDICPESVTAQARKVFGWNLAWIAADACDSQSLL